MSDDPFDQLRRELLAERHQPHPEHVPTVGQRNAETAMHDLVRAGEQRTRLRLVQGGAA